MNRLLMFVFACSAALSASAGVAYLAVLGPAPLRFETRARPNPRALALLPPLLTENPLPLAPPTNAVWQTTAPNLSSPTVTSNLAVAVVSNLPIVTTVSVTNSPPLVLLPGPQQPTGPLLGPLFDPNDPNSLITAQMLIHYFRPHGTNAGGAIVAVPLFIPPRPTLPQPSSTVRYTTP